MYLKSAVSALYQQQPRVRAPIRMGGGGARAAMDCMDGAARAA